MAVLSRGGLLAALVLWGCGEAPPTPAPTPTGAPVAFPVFTDITAAAGLTHGNVSGTPAQGQIIETMSAAVALLDYDGDADLDLFFVGGTRRSGPPQHSNRLYRNDGPGPDGAGVPRLRDVTIEAGVDHVGWGMGVAVGDTDADGDLDLYVTQWGPNLLYRNDGDGSFTEIGTTAGVDDGNWGSSAAFGDVDGDGHLDLYLTNYLEYDAAAPPGGGEPCSYKGMGVYCGPLDVPRQADRLFRNRGDGTFVDVTAATGVASLLRAGLGVLFADLDDDGDSDLYIANDSDPNTLYRNDGGWRLTEVGAMAGAAFTEDGQSQSGMGVAAGDYDRDGDTDLFVTNFADDYNTLYRNDRDWRFADASAAAGLIGTSRPLLGWSTGMVDFDGDGWLDLFVVNGHLYPDLRDNADGITYRQRNLLYRNDGGRFVEIDGGPDWQRPAVSRAAAAGDIDDDGDTDLIVVDMNDRPCLLRNDGGNRLAWLGLHLRSAAGTDAIGARVEVVAGADHQRAEVRRGTGFQSSQDVRLRFGLGAATAIDSVRVRWPSGRIQVLTDLSTRRYHTVHEAGEVIAGPRVAPPTPTPARAPRPAVSVAPVAIAAEHAGASATELISRGKAHYRKGRYPQAEAYLRRGLRLAPDSLQAQVNLAVVLYSGLNRGAEAARLLEEVAAKAPGRADVPLLLGKVFLSLDRTPEAVAAFGRAASLLPESYETHTWVGIAELRRGGLAAARASLERAVRLGPGEAQPHLLLAQTYDRLGRVDDARRFAARHQRLAALEDELEILHQRTLRDPGDVGALNRMGMLLLSRGELRKAGGAFREALLLDTENGPAWYGVGSVLARQGDMARAEAAFARAAAQSPDDARTLNDLGMARLQIGRLADAVEAFRRALEARDDIALVHINLGRALAGLGRRQEAHAAWTRALELEPRNREAAARIQRLNGN